MKPCRKCGAEDRAPSGSCRPCAKVYRQQPGYAAKNLERQLKWQQKHPEKLKAHQQRAKLLRRGRKYEAAGHSSRPQILQRWAMFGGMCWICQKVAATSTDHVLALCRGGTNWTSNLRPACHSCNSAKTTMDKRGASVAEIMEWAKSRRLDVA